MASVHGAHLRKQAAEDLRRLAAAAAPSTPPAAPRLPPAGMTSAEAKAALRREAKMRRQAAHEASRDAGLRVRDNFLAALSIPASAVIGSYWPFASELDAAPLLTHLHACGHVCALPALVAADRPLRFRVWRPDDRLTFGTLGEPAPDPRRPEVRPEVLLVPLLAFDRRGYRLGYGGGYYDRTLAALRSKNGIVAVGLAYAAQEVESVPHDVQDERLDWVVTERFAIETGG